MAAAASAPDAIRPRWTVEFAVDISFLGLSLITELLATLSWFDWVIAATTGSRVTGTMTFFPGSNLSYRPSARASSISIGLGWVCLFVAFIAFVLAAHIWRLLTRQVV
jgi:hypothetical protein